MKVVVVLAGLGLAFWSTSVFAGNDEGIALGDEAALTGGAVAAKVSDGSSLFYNPAGLAAADRDQVDVSATVTLLRFYRVPRLVTTTSGAATSGSFTEFVSVPSAVSYIRGLGRDTKLGVGVFVPESTSWNIDASLSEGGRTFRLNTTQRQSLYYGIVGIGWRATPSFNLGASVAGLYLSGLGTAAAWSGYSGANGLGQLYGLSDQFSSSAIGATMAIGAQWEPRRGLRLGMSVRAPTITLTTTVHGSEVEASATNSPPTATLTSQDVNDSTRSIHQARSLRARLGIAKSWGTNWFSVEGDAQPGVTDLAIGTRRRPNWNLRAGGMFSLYDQVWLGAGAFTDRSGERQAQGLLESRIDFYGATCGLRIDHTHNLAAGEAPPSVIFSTTIGTHYAYGTGKVGGVLFDPAPGASIPARNSAVSAQVHELGLYLGSSLYF